MLCHLTTVALNTKVRNLTGALFKAKECVEITEDIERKIFFFPSKVHANTKIHPRTNHPYLLTASYL